jgi:HTH-type transcriptional regulator/antitoxin HigA
MTIHNEMDYRSALTQLDELMQKAPEQLTRTQLDALKQLASAIQSYEEKTYALPKPTTLLGMIELRMFERKLKQKDLAQLLEEPESRISEVLNEKREISMKLAKKLYQKLNIPAEFILEHA